MKKKTQKKQTKETGRLSNINKKKKKKEEHGNESKKKKAIEKQVYKVSNYA